MRKEGRVDKRANSTGRVSAAVGADRRLRRRALGWLLKSGRVDRLFLEVFWEVGVMVSGAQQSF